jgi:hypothetical protein
VLEDIPEKIDKREMNINSGSIENAIPVIYSNIVTGGKSSHDDEKKTNKNYRKRKRNKYCHSILNKENGSICACSNYRDKISTMTSENKQPYNNVQKTNLITRLSDKQVQDINIAVSAKYETVI